MFLEKVKQGIASEGELFHWSNISENVFGFPSGR